MWSDLEAGDALIDTELTGNDHILVRKIEGQGVWLLIDNGEVIHDGPLLDKPLGNGWDVYRGGELVCST